MSWDESEHFNELSWCPECQSPPSSDYAHVLYCQQHQPTADGVSDRLVEDTGYITRGDATGESNSAWCAFLHRQGD